jgi:hypothetical protein
VKHERDWLAVGACAPEGCKKARLIGSHTSACLCVFLENDDNYRTAKIISMEFDINALFSKIYLHVPSLVKIGQQ